MNIKPRLIAYAAIISLIISILSGCADTSLQRQSSQPASADSNEHMDISVAIWDLPDSSLEDDPLVKRLEEKLNITIKPVPIAVANYVQQFQMWASTGQLPDIFAVDAVNSQYYRNWRDQGVIRPLPADLKRYPNLAQYLAMPEFEDLKDNGKLFSSRARHMTARSIMCSIDLSLTDGIWRKQQALRRSLRLGNNSAPC
ncbi:type 2 periplasmic-binding domain-containing protein [Paenibacillus albus]|uniref:hypothetical protein n=1 Tax=Paenibacillus albus TaxID=2495582 RepID=UPI0013E0A0E0|nr:hypothetical protein [Paenibacillus albus]